MTQKKIATSNHIGIVHWFLGGFIFPAVLVFVIGLAVFTSILDSSFFNKTDAELEIFFASPMFITVSVTIALISNIIATYVSSWYINRRYVITQVKEIAVTASVIMLVIQILSTIFSKDMNISGVENIMAVVSVVIFYGISMRTLKKDTSQDSSAH